MTKSLTSFPGLVASMVLGVVLTCYLSGPAPTATPAVGQAQGAIAPRESLTLAPVDPWYQAIGVANQATELATAATTATQWQQTAGAWGEAIGLLHSISPADPRYPFSQRKAREYQHNQFLAHQQANQQGMPRALPTLGSDVLDEQVSLYRAYVATLGPPDVLIVGSSRSLQGVDPQVLQQALALEGYPGLRVYNFSVNGATAQVISFITRQLLAPELYPRLIIWAEGSRAFNSARFDRTFAEILASPGYAAVRDGATLTVQNPSAKASPLEERATETEENAPASTPESDPESAAIVADPAESAPHGTLPLSPINSQGFLAVNDQFNPAVYYRSYPRVRGIYDNAYRPFRLTGVQRVSFEAMAQFLQSQNIPLVYVNLPLSNDYLDPVRLGYERQFQSFLQTQANQGTLTLLDMLEDWRWTSHLFADPSHVNRYGAREVARLIAADSRISWPHSN